MYLIGGVDSYRQTVVNSARLAAVEPRIEIAGWKLSYLTLLVILGILMIFQHCVILF